MSEREGEGKEDGHGVRYGAGYGDGVGVGLGVGLGGGGIGGGIGSERGGRRGDSAEIERRREEGRVLRRAKRSLWHWEWCRDRRLLTPPQHRID